MKYSVYLNFSPNLMEEEGLLRDQRRCPRTELRPARRHAGLPFNFNGLRYQASG